VIQTTLSNTGIRSPADFFLSLPLEIRQERWSALTEVDQEALAYEWEPFWARPEQLMPPGPWTYWLIKAGRGWGKTRSGAECVRIWVRTSRYVNLIAPTADDARDVMIEGESGILAICPRGERPLYVPSKRRLEWPNGSRSLIFSADEPERLRGKQHAKLWCDELAAWRYPESWDQAQFGLRLGANPQCVVTTTPRPTPVVKELMRHPACVITGGASYENRANLADAFFATIVKKYEGTRLGRQELNAELLDDNPGALWQRKQIDATRIGTLPSLKRIVIGVDPAVTSREDSDETGIIAVGIGAAPAGSAVAGEHYFVFADASLIGTPDAWARAAVRLYHESKADRLIAETNNGGEMVELTIRTVDANVSYKAVTASRGKQVRAEPIAALYEQGRVHHVGSLPKLEDQMCDWDPLTSPFSPDRMDALVWALTELSDESDMGMFRYYERLAAAQAAMQVPLPTVASTTRTAAGWPA
jgi:phage terminase large subunit-like protein